MKKKKESTGRIEPMVKRPNCLWVVEWFDHGKKWDPTVGAYLSKKEALEGKKNDWEYNNPDDRFRVRKYVTV